MGAARLARHQLNAPSTDPREIAELEGALSRLQAELGADARDRLLRQGDRMSLDGALLFALAPV